MQNVLKAWKLGSVRETQTQLCRNLGGPYGLGLRFVPFPSFTGVVVCGVVVWVLVVCGVVWWCGVVWFGVMWCGWCDVVWCGVVWCGVV